MVWVFIRAWAALYGVVTLEVFGHMDPRIIESGAMFDDDRCASGYRSWASTDDMERLTAPRWQPELCEDSHGDRPALPALGSGDVRVRRRRRQHPHLPRARRGVRRGPARPAHAGGRPRRAGRRRRGDDRGRRRLPRLLRRSVRGVGAGRTAGRARGCRGRGAAAAAPLPARTPATPYPSTATTSPSRSTSPRGSPARRTPGQVLVTDAVVEDLDASVGEPPVEVGTYEPEGPPRADPDLAGRRRPDAAASDARAAYQRAGSRGPASWGGPRSWTGSASWSGTPGLVSVVGPGGTGKTRLVSELALRGDGSLPGGAWLVELAPLESPDQVVAAAGAAVGLASADLDADRRRAPAPRPLRCWCWTTASTCSTASSTWSRRCWMPCPELTVLCTSREALQLRRRTGLDAPSAAGRRAPRPSSSSTRATDAADATPDLDLVLPAVRGPGRAAPGDRARRQPGARRAAAGDPRSRDRRDRRARAPRRRDPAAEPGRRPPVEPGPPRAGGPRLAPAALGLPWPVQPETWPGGAGRRAAR